MTDDPTFVCLDSEVPLHLRTVVEDKAIEVRPDNEGRVFEANADPLRFWATGTQLRVRFLDGQDLVRRVMDAASAWTEHANLTFTVVDDDSAHIRVTFIGSGNWSATGTESVTPQLYPPEAPSMCLAEVPRAISSLRVDRVVRHEFGHALGLQHEHQSPAAGIRWNKPVVYAALAQPPNSWSREQVDRNVFRRYSATTTSFSEFDPESIMLYTYPPEWTEDGQGFPMNHELSATDREFISKTYP
jgi:hypothetical protein